MLVCFFHREGCGYVDESTDECVADAAEIGTAWDWNGDEVDIIARSEVRSPANRPSRANMNVACSAA